MPPRISIILSRLRQDVAAAISAESILSACKDVGYHWRKRVLGPVETIHLFLLQVLLKNTACQHIVQLGEWRFTDTAYCAARKRLPLALFYKLVEQTAGALRDASDGCRWLGLRVWTIDGSSCSMPDTPELQAHFGQPSGQRKGCGFPVAKLLTLFHVSTGMLLRMTVARLRSHDMSGAAAISDELKAGDLVLGDRGFCSYAHLAMLIGRGVFGVFRMHQKQNVDFTPGRPKARSKAPTQGRKGCRVRGGCWPTVRWTRWSNGSSQRSVRHG